MPTTAFRSAACLRSASIFITCLVAIALWGACTAKKAATEASQEDREQLYSLLDSVLADGAITTVSAGRMPGISPMYERRQRLISMATDDELDGWRTHEAPHLRAIVLEAYLLRDAHQALDAALPQVLNDRNAVPFMQGDMMLSVPMLEYVYSYLLGEAVPGQPLPDGAAPPKSTYKAPDAWLRKAQMMLRSGAYTE